MRKLALAGLAAAFSITTVCGVALADAPVPAAEPQVTADAPAATAAGVVTLAPEGDSYTSWEIVGEQPRIVRDGSGCVLLAPDGSELGTESYGYIGDVVGSDNGSFPYFFAVNENGVNVQAVLGSDGARLSDFVYGDLFAVSDKWLLGLVLAPSDSEAAMYRDGDGNRYAVETVDIYYQGTCIGSLPGEDYAGSFTASAYNDYLVLETTTDGVFKCVDPQMNVNDLLGYGATDTGYWQRGQEYYINAEGIPVHISGVPVFTPECTLDPATVVCPYTVRGDGLKMLDLTGAEVAKLSFRGSDFGGFVNGYGIIRGFDGGDNSYRAVVNEAFELVTPLEYDMIGEWNELGSAVVGGYIRVVKDGQVGYYSIDGTNTVPVQYAESAAVLSRGLCTVMQDMDGTYRIVSAEKGLLDGTYSDYVNFAGGYQSPILLMCDKESGLWGVVDYNGNVVVPFEYANSWEIELPEDGSFALVCPSDADEAYVYPYAMGEKPAEPVAVAPAAEAEPAEEPAAEGEPASEEPASDGQADTGSAVSKLLGKIKQGE